MPLTTRPSIVRTTRRGATAIGRAMCVGLAFFMVGLAAFGPALAQAADAALLAAETRSVMTLRVPAGKSVALRVDGLVDRIVVAQPEIARVDVAGGQHVYVMGRALGTTNLLVYGPGSDTPQVVNVAVGYDGVQLEDDLRTALPDEPITVETLNDGLLLRGDVSSSETAQAAMSMAERAAPGAIVDRLDVWRSQVRLDVQLVEISEAKLRDLGASVTADGAHLTLRSGGGLVGSDPPQTTAHVDGRLAGLDLAATVRALERRGAARVVAQPHLVALSGETAGFRAGGEFPFPVPTGDGKVAIAFRPYGASLSVIPTVQTNGMIRLQLATELSSLDLRNSVRLGGVIVPALLTRRAATTAELKDGDTLLIAGMFQDSREDQANATPYLGRLLASSRDRTQRLELSILVTAHRVDRGRGAERQARDLARADTLENSAADPEPPAPIAQPAKPKGLAKLIQRSPLATVFAARVGDVLHAALDLPRRGWAAFEGWSDRLTRSARGRGPADAG